MPQMGSLKGKNAESSINRHPNKTKCTQCTMAHYQINTPVVSDLTLLNSLAFIAVPGLSLRGRVGQWVGTHLESDRQTVLQGRLICHLAVGTLGQVLDLSIRVK